MSIARLEINGAIASIIINRPNAMNALGQDGDGDAFVMACNEINADKNIRATILTGEGKAFSAGGDLKAMRDKTGNFSGSPAEIADSYRNNIHKIIKSLWNLETPLISAINGPAIGLGCDVACMGDIRIASKHAVFGITFLKIGLIPGDGGAWLAPRIIGMSRAAELLYTGEVIDAQKAKEWGFVSDVVEHDELIDAANAIAGRVASQPPLAVRATKKLLRQSYDSSFNNILEMSANIQGLMHHTNDHLEGVEAMIDKRHPHFYGN